MANHEQIIEAIKEMSVLELNDLVKAIEEEFGVTAAAPVAVAGAAGGAGTAVAALGRATVMRFIKRWGVRKTAAW